MKYVLYSAVTKMVVLPEYPLLWLLTVFGPWNTSKFYYLVEFDYTCSLLGRRMVGNKSVVGTKALKECENVREIFLKDLFFGLTI